MKKGDSVKCIFDSILPGNSKGPSLEAGKDYTVENTFIDKGGNLHVDVGLTLEIGFVTSYATKEELPGEVHWCHPNRFVLK